MSDAPNWDGPLDNPIVIDHSPSREAVPALVSGWGPSDSGKTYSFLLFARGLVGPKGLIIVIDTENKRAKYYAHDPLIGGFSHIDLQPPFTPERYLSAHNAAVKACMEHTAKTGAAGVIIIDSMSHVWEGEGGVLWQADQVKTEGLNKWRKPKMAYKRMCMSLWRTPVNTIFLLRAKEKYLQVGKGKDAVVESIGQVPICGNDFIYEMQVNIHMESGTHLPLDPVKIPAGMPKVIMPGQLITKEMGAMFAQYQAGGVVVDQRIIALQREARLAATKGRADLSLWWGKNVSKTDRAKMMEIHAELAQMAADADEEREASEQPKDETTKSNPLDQGL